MLTVQDWFFHHLQHPKRLVCCMVVVVWSRTSKQAVEEQKKVEETLAAEVDTARSRISEIQNELEGVVEQLGEAKVLALNLNTPKSFVTNSRRHW